VILPICSPWSPKLVCTPKEEEKKKGYEKNSEGIIVEN